MYTRDTIPVVLVNEVRLSSDTSTSVPTAVDLANYFPVGRREVEFVIVQNANTTTLSNISTIVLQECASTATASFTNIVSAAGTTATFTTTANTIPVQQTFMGVVNYRYIRALTVASTATGGYVSNIAMAFPITRAA